MGYSNVIHSDFAFLFAEFALFVNELVQTQKGRYKQSTEEKDKNNCETKKSSKILMLCFKLLLKTKIAFNIIFSTSFILLRLLRLQKDQILRPRHIGN